MEVRDVDGPSRWLALATCAVCAVPLVVQIVRRPTPATPREIAWLALCAAFLACFLVFTRWSAGADGAPLGVARLAVLTALALAMVWTLPYTLTAVFFVVVAAGLGETLPLARATAWVVAQTALFTLAVVPGLGTAGGATVGAAFLGFQLFALHATHAGTRERRGRQALARINAELVATRRLLAESSRNAERLRIARDLHDVLGHHLTALSLHLEAARHAGSEASRRAVETAHGIAGGLLAEVRQVVGRLRDDCDVDLAAALSDLAAAVERPRVHLRLPAGFRGVADPARAEALLRCAQEAVTNAVRHAGAENLWIEVTDGAGGVELTARDDGRGAGGEGGGSGGLGLAGMRERLERLGGRLAVDSRPGAGFRVTAWLPAAAAPPAGEAP